MKMLAQIESSRNFYNNFSSKSAIVSQDILASKSKKSAPKTDSVQINNFEFNQQVEKLAKRLETTQMYTKSASTVVATNLLQGHKIEVVA